mmetsp:Transcript_2396/g.5419  ORF Transcript_2396/g.5419 Transcript_2396/m.5419 type:complete len:232 (+) Transcript_2396:1461-2156(+)
MQTSGVHQALHHTGAATELKTLLWECGRFESEYYAVVPDPAPLIAAEEPLAQAKYGQGVGRRRVADLGTLVQTMQLVPHCVEVQNAQGSCKAQVVGLEVEQFAILEYVCAPPPSLVPPGRALLEIALHRRQTRTYRKNPLRRWHPLSALLPLLDQTLTISLQSLHLAFAEGQLISSMVNQGGRGFLYGPEALQHPLCHCAFCGGAALIDGGLTLFKEEVVIGKLGFIIFDL